MSASTNQLQVGWRPFFSWTELSYRPSNVPRQNKDDCQSIVETRKFQQQMVDSFILAFTTGPVGPATGIRRSKVFVKATFKHSRWSNTSILHFLALLKIGFEVITLSNPINYGTQALGWLWALTLSFNKEMSPKWMPLQTGIRKSVRLVLDLLTFSFLWRFLSIRVWSDSYLWCSIVFVIFFYRHVVVYLPPFK